MYLAGASAGYLSMGNSVPDFVISRPALPGSNDIWMTFGQIGLFCGLVVATSLRILSNKDNVMSLFSAPKTALTEKMSETQPVQQSKFTQRDILVMLVIGLLPYLASLLLNENVNGIISLISSLLCPFFIVILPAWVNIKLRSKFNYSNKTVFLIKLYVVVYTVLLAISIGVNVYNFISGHAVVG